MDIPAVHRCLYHFTPPCYAHSVEAWYENQLVGGLYGIAVGKNFTGESMFRLHANASWFAMISLARFLDQNGFNYIDAQVYNPYVASFGGGEVAGPILQNNESQSAEPRFIGSLVGSMEP